MTGAGQGGVQGGGGQGAGEQVLIRADEVAFSGGGASQAQVEVPSSAGRRLLAS